MYKPPVFLDLTKMHFPITAIASILHRVTGVIIFLSLPILLWFFESSLHSETTFNQIKTLFHHLTYGIILWGISVAFIYHALGGIRHLLMDVGIGETLIVGRISAWVVIILSILIAIYLGVCWLW